MHTHCVHKEGSEGGSCPVTRVFLCLPMFFLSSRPHVFSCPHIVLGCLCVTCGLYIHFVCVCRWSIMYIIQLFTIYSVFLRIVCAFIIRIGYRHTRTKCMETANIHPTRIAVVQQWNSDIKQDFQCKHINIGCYSQSLYVAATKIQLYSVTDTMQVHP